MRMPSSEVIKPEINRRLAVFESDMKVYGFLLYWLPFAEIKTKYSENEWAYRCFFFGENYFKVAL